MGGSGLHRGEGPVESFRSGDHFAANHVGVDTFIRFDGFNHDTNGDLTFPVVSAGYNQNYAFDPPTPMPFNSLAGDGEENDSHKDPEICSDLALRYINRILMEEDTDTDDKAEADLTHPDSALLAAEKPFREILNTAGGEAEHSSSQDGSVNSSTLCVSHVDSSCESSIGEALDDNLLSEYVCELHSLPELRSLCLHCAPQSPLSSNDSSACCSVEDARSSYSNIVLENEHMWECQFRRGMEEARKFLPDANKLVIDLKSTEFFHPEENKLRGRKKPYLEEDLDPEEKRNTKQSAVVIEEPVRTTIFDEVLLCNCGKNRDAVSLLSEALQNEIRKNARNGEGKTRGRNKKHTKIKKEVIDLRTLLIHCAQYVATDDRRSAGELLRQIRRHSADLEKGDGTQRLARIFADGLEARLAGTGSERYHSFMAKRQSTINILKAYHLVIAACPFKRISHFFSNKTILNVAENAKKLHIVDFGISFGFQWPCLIHRLSGRSGGPPELRITGIDAPQPGFRPTERLVETGRRLDDYSKSFGVPFKYQHIAATRWEDIEIGDLNLREDEVLVVNCMYRFRHVAADETTTPSSSEEKGSPRSVLLEKVRRMKPEIFIHGVVNGSFSAPFFVTRFREALFHYSSLFDMLDATVPREHPERLLIETEIFGPEAMNVIACEGSERVERPETYKQWQGRNSRAGFRQLPLNPVITKTCRDRVRSFYHRDFLFDENGGWLLQGWKGRIIYALSTWKPHHHHAF